MTRTQYKNNHIREWFWKRWTLPKIFLQKAGILCTCNHRIYKTRKIHQWSYSLHRTDTYWISSGWKSRMFTGNCRFNHQIRNQLWGYPWSWQIPLGQNALQLHIKPIRCDSQLHLRPAYRKPIYSGVDEQHYQWNFWSYQSFPIWNSVEDIRGV